MTNTKKFGVLFLSFGIALIFIGTAGLLDHSTIDKSDVVYAYIMATIFTMAGLMMVTAKSKPKKINEDEIVKLERLSKLFQQGILDEKEFAEQKKKILG